MKKSIKNTFFAIILLGSGQFLLSATMPYQTSNFDWSKAFDSHYYTTGYGVRIAKVKKDTDPPKKKIETGAKVSVASRIAAVEGEKGKTTPPTPKNNSAGKAPNPSNGQYKTAKTLANRLNENSANGQYQTLPKKPENAPDNKIQLPKSNSAPGRLPSNQYGKVNVTTPANGQYKTTKTLANRLNENSANGQYQTLPKKPENAPDNKIQLPTKVNKQYESTNAKISGGSANQLPTPKNTSTAAPKPRVPITGRPLPTPPVKTKNTSSSSSKAKTTSTRRKKH